MERQDRFIVKLSTGAEVDLTDIPPITLGDKKALKARGIDLTKLARDQTVDPEHEAELVLYLVRKRRAETTMEEIDALPAVTAGRILAYAMRRSAEVDDPFSTRSTSSPQPTAGGETNSSATPQQS
jgi:hypothetical protein